MLNKLKNLWISPKSKEFEPLLINNKSRLINFKPMTRWWWLNGPFIIKDIEAQFIWLKSQGFGGVEIAWLTPLWEVDINSHQKIDWLSKKFGDILQKTKKLADEMDLICDFTFGSCWPFGGSFVAKRDRAQTFKGISSHLLTSGWEFPKESYIIDHLSKTALTNYFETMMSSFSPLSQGSKSALFCDSLELGNNTIWSPGLWQKFENQFGYSLRDQYHFLESNNRIRYDTRKLLSKTFIDNFCKTFSELSHKSGFACRMQCHGAPCDLISAYLTIDIPESEVLLFPPTFSRIAASSSTLGQKPITSCETFTCIYGFHQPLETINKEYIEDLKLVFDSVVANGINQIVWHGMPYNPINKQTNRFYASTHIGPTSSFINDLLSFNKYMEKICNFMRTGKNHHTLAVYLPNEDMMMLDRLPKELSTPGAQLYWDMRYVRIPEELKGHSPIWISGDILFKIKVIGDNLCCGDMQVPALYIDVEWLDFDSLKELVRINSEGGKIVVKRKPAQPGYILSDLYDNLLNVLLTHRNTYFELKTCPILEGDNLPPFWCRKDELALSLFFAHPSVAEVSYPLKFHQSDDLTCITREVKIYLPSQEFVKVNLKFKKSSIMLRLGFDLSIELV